MTAEESNAGFLLKPSIKFSMSGRWAEVKQPLQKSLETALYLSVQRHNPSGTVGASLAMFEQGTPPFRSHVEEEDANFSAPLLY